MTSSDPRLADHLAARVEPSFLLGGPPEMTAGEVSAFAGVPEDLARRLWRALGFPEVGMQAAFTQHDAAALRRLMAAVESSELDVDTALRLTRAAGQQLSRLAEAQVATLALRAARLEQEEDGSGSKILDALHLRAEAVHWFEKLIIYVWRRHMAAAIARAEALSDAEENVTTVDVSVGFADIVGFTALSNELDQDQIGDLVEIFEARCGDVVASHGGRLVKTLGDSVLFISDLPEVALDVAEGIIEVIGRDARLPDVRLGLATGSVVLRLGDVFGPPVNLAARLTTVARRNRIITDLATAEALPQDRFDWRPLAPRPLRGFGHVEPVTVRRR